MGDQSIAGRGTERPGGGQAPRLAVIDTDSGLLRVLGKRLDRLGWEYRVLGRAGPVGALVAMRLGAVVVGPLVWVGWGGGGPGGGGGGGVGAAWAGVWGVAGVGGGGVYGAVVGGSAGAGVAVGGG